MPLPLVAFSRVSHQANPSAAVFRFSPPGAVTISHEPLPTSRPLSDQATFLLRCCRREEARCRSEFRTAGEARNPPPGNICDCLLSPFCVSGATTNRAPSRISFLVAALGQPRRPPPETAFFRRKQPVNRRKSFEAAVFRDCYAYWSPLTSST